MSALEEQFLQARRAALGIVAAQLGVALLSSAVGWLLAGSGAAVSALMGGGIGTLASFVAAASAFRPGASREPAKILGRLYRGEAFKLVVTAGLFAWVLMSMETDFGAMMGGFAATLLVYWGALLRSPGPTVSAGLQRVPFQATETRYGSRG